MRIKNGLVFSEQHTMVKKDLCFEKGVITDFSSEGEIDAEGLYVLPGFIDTHIHGAFGAKFYMDNSPLSPALDYLSHEGVTSVLATFVSETEQEYLADCERLMKANDDRIIGIHLEGPFLNPARKGGMLENRLQKPDTELLKKINSYSDNALKIVSIAPEIAGAETIIKWCSQNGIKASMAHSNATFEEASIGAEHGITRATHLYNAMRSFAHREAGIIGFALCDKRINAELICDLHHVSAPAIKIALKAKGAEEITMISDCDFYCGLPEGKYGEITVSGGFAKLTDGTICGSACSLAMGAKNMFHLGVSPEEIAIMACVNPAKAAGATDRGELGIGMRADIILLDNKFNVVSVFSKGNKIR